MKDVSYRQLVLEGEDTKSFKELHNILFKNTAMSDEWMRWYFTISEDVRVYGAFADKVLVGIWCVEGKHLNVPLRGMTNVGRCFSVGVHPSFQRKGIFLNLSKFAIAQEKKKGKYEYILGFPQFGKSVIDGHLKAGWEFVQNIEMCSIRPNIVDEASSLSSVKTLSRFDDDQLEYVQTNNLGDFRLTTKYRNQRWMNHPDTHYICLSIDDAHIVLKQYGDSCHIVELAGPNEDVADLLEATKTLARRHAWKEVNLWCAENDCKHDIIKGCGFSLGSERGIGVKLLAVKINAGVSLKLNECNFQMGLEEVY